MKSTNPDVMTQLFFKQMGHHRVAIPQFRGIQDATVLDTDATNPTANPAGMCRVVCPAYGATIALGPTPYPGTIAPVDGSTVTIAFVPPQAGRPTVATPRILTLVNGVSSTTAWTTVAYTTGWEAEPATEGIQFRSVGDIVYLRGRGLRSTGSSLTICTLPQGPPSAEFFPVISDGATAIVKVTSNGKVIFTGSTAQASSGVAVSNVFFSTTS